MGRYNNSLSLDATIMVSKNCPIIVEHVVIIFSTEYVTIATVWPPKKLKKDNPDSEDYPNFRPISNLRFYQK